MSTNSTSIKMHYLSQNFSNSSMWNIQLSSSTSALGLTFRTSVVATIAVEISSCTVKNTCYLNTLISHCSVNGLFAWIFYCYSSHCTRCQWSFSFILSYAKLHVFFFIKEHHIDTYRNKLLLILSIRTLEILYVAHILYWFKSCFKSYNFSVFSKICTQGS